MLSEEKISHLSHVFLKGLLDHNLVEAKNEEGKIRRQIKLSVSSFLKIGEDIDTESGNSHLGHAMANLAMAIDTLHNKSQFDDRYKDNKVTAEAVLPEVTQTFYEDGWTILESDMIYLEKGSVVHRAAGDKLRIEADGTFPVKKGDVVVNASKD